MSIIKSTSIKPFEQLQLSDNFMFSAVMQDLDNCKNFLELVLGIKISRLSVPQAEKTIKYTPESKGIRLDVYTEDNANVFDIEMQTSAGNLPKRARYYQSLMDIGILKKGKYYNELKNSIVIFVCSFDEFGNNLPVYSFENICKEDSTIRLNDRTLKVFLNIYGNREGLPEGLCNLFDCFISGEAKDEFTGKLVKDMEMIKNSDSWRDNYLEWNAVLMDERYYAKKEGFEEGKIQGLHLAGCSDKKIAEILNISIEKVEEVLSTNSVVG